MKISSYRDSYHWNGVLKRVGVSTYEGRDCLIAAGIQMWRIYKAAHSEYTRCENHVFILVFSTHLVYDKENKQVALERYASPDFWRQSRLVENYSFLDWTNVESYSRISREVRVIDGRSGVATGPEVTLEMIYEIVVKS